MIIAARPGETAGCLISGVVPLSSRSSTPSALMYSLPYNIAITFITRRCTHWHKTAEPCVLYYILYIRDPIYIGVLPGLVVVVLLFSPPIYLRSQLAPPGFFFLSFYIFSTDASSSSCCCCYPSAVAPFLCVSLPERLYTRYDYTRTRHLKTMIYSLGVLITGQVSSAATGSSSPSFPALYLIVVRERRATAQKERTRIIVVG